MEPAELSAQPRRSLLRYILLGQFHWRRLADAPMQKVRRLILFHETAAHVPDLNECQRQGALKPLIRA